MCMVFTGAFPLFAELLMLKINAGMIIIQLINGMEDAI